MNKYIILLITLAGIALTGCQQDGHSEISETDLQISATIDQLVSRVNSTGFEANDKIGIYVTDTTAKDTQTIVGISIASRKNNAFTFKDNKWETGNKIYWEKYQGINIYAYHPYKETIANPKAFDHSVAETQTAETFKTNDLLYSNNVKNQEPTKTAVSMTFRHIMSKLIINLKAGTGFTKDKKVITDATVVINKLQLASTVNLGNGVVTASTKDAKKDITPLKATTAAKDMEATHSALLIPQKVGKDSVLVTVSVDGVLYEYKAAEEINLQSGYQRTLTITVNKTGLSVTVGDIETWKTDTELANSDTKVNGIYSAEDLMNFAKAVNSSASLAPWESTINGVTAVRVWKDIDALDLTNWEPISGFKGKFFGQKRLLSNLTYESKTVTSALFVDSTGEIKELELKDCAYTYNGGDYEELTLTEIID